MKPSRRVKIKIKLPLDIAWPGGNFDGMSAPGPGSSGNVLAAVCSFFIPGLGQLVQGRILMALIMFVLAGALWFVFLGWLIHIWSVIDAALYRGF
jgi:hypothetical protein